MKISLHGSYFRDNYGDILLMEIFTKWVKEYFPNAQINYPLLKKNRISGLNNDFTTGLFNLIRSEALVFFGGGYFGEQPQHKLYWSIRNYFRHIIIGNIARLFHIPYAIIGVEFGPLSVKWFRKRALKVIMNADFVVARNEQSVKFLESNGISNVISSMDAVLSLTMPTDKTEMEVLLHLPGAYRDISKIELIVKLIIPEFHKRNIVNICFIEDDKDQYIHTNYNRIFDILKKEGIQYDIHKYKGTNDLISVINRAACVITTKLHVGITALALNKKVFSIYHHPKTLRLHTQVGNAQNCLFLSDIDESVANMISAFFNSPQYSLPENCRRNALCNKVILQEFLSHIKK